MENSYQKIRTEIEKLWQLTKVCQALFFDERKVHERYFLRIDTETLTNAGLIKRDGNYFVALKRLHKIADAFVVTDLASYMGHDQVFPLHPENYYFVDKLQLKPGMSVLDLGTGSGVFAIVAAQCGCQVTATENNAKAAEYARFNAALNGVALELLEVDHFEYFKQHPRQFDYIMSNPPFEPVPKELSGYYKHSFAGEDGLDAARKQLLMFPPLLKENGIFQMVVFSVASVREPRLPKILDEIDDRFAGKQTFSYQVEYSMPIKLETFGKRFEDRFLGKEYVKQWLKRSTEHVFIAMLFIQNAEDLDRRYNKWVNPADVDGVGQETPMGYKPRIHEVPLE